MDNLFSPGPTSLFVLILVISLFNAGLLILADKWGISDFYRAKRKRWMPEYCEFCTFFWLALLQLSYFFYLCPLSFEFWYVSMLVVFSICSAVLSRFVL